MYCPRCGKRISNDVNFCPGCGASITSVSRGFKESTSQEPIFVLKPRFIPSVAVLSILPFQIFFTIWGGLFFGGFIGFGMKALGLNLPLWFMFVFFGCLFFFGIPIVTYLAGKKTYQRTEFRFYPNRLDYYEGFFTIEEKTIDYRNITEVNLRRNIFQRKYGLGTIILSTPATGYSKGAALSGIRIFDIERPQEIYRQVKELIEKAR